jgi:hypothetical protein
MTRMSSPVRSHHSHSHSHSMSQSSNPPRSPSPPSQTFHPGSILLPTPALVESVAGGAHYSGAKMDSDVAVTHRRPSGGDKRDSDSHTDLLPAHQIIRDDLNEMFGARTTIEILRRSWSKDAIFEVRSCYFLSLFCTNFCFS